MTLEESAREVALGMQHERLMVIEYLHLRGKEAMARGDLDANNVLLAAATGILGKDHIP